MEWRWEVWGLVVEEGLGRCLGKGEEVGWGRLERVGRVEVGGLGVVREWEVSYGG